MLNMIESIDLHGPVAEPFQPTLEAANQLLTIMGEFSRNFATNADPQLLFDGLLSNFLTVTDSEYGFIGERLQRPDGRLYLKTHAITNIAWDEATLAFYEEHAPMGLEFDRLDSLFGQVILTGRPLISNSPKTDPRACGIPEGHPDLHCFLGIPLMLGEKFLGMAGIANREGGYDAELLRYLEPLISSTAALIYAVQMENIASHDSLTGLANRRLFDKRYAVEASRQVRHGSHLSLLLLDIDHFKDINDSLGHHIGDCCLTHVAEILTNRMRAEDLVARMGGDEFVVLLPDTSAQEAVVVAEQLRESIAQKHCMLGESQEPVKITVSVGIASIEGKKGVSYEEILQQADKALYGAKCRGRNHVHIDSP